MQAEHKNYEGLARSILNTDPRIFSCIIVSDPHGATLAEAERTEMRDKLGALTQRSNGMAGHWGILAFKAMERLDGVRTKVKYIVVAREAYNAMIFPASRPEKLMIALTFKLKTDAEELFQIIFKLFEDSNSIANM
jgi:hypothetical protein